MKTKLALGVAGAWSGLAVGVFAGAGEVDRPTAGPASNNVTVTAALPSNAAASSAALTFTEAREIVLAGRRYVAHPATATTGEVSSSPSYNAFAIATRPPPPRAETKPAAPVTGYVWVAGHYMPVKGEWRWVRGEWAAPATPASVWVPAEYDAEKKVWNPGYWQPDRPAPAEGKETVGAPAKASGY